MGKMVATGKTRMIKAERRLFQHIFLAKDLGKTVELSRSFRHTKFPIPLSLTDTAGVQLHHIQKSYLRSGH